MEVFMKFTKKIIVSMCAAPLFLVAGESEDLARDMLHVTHYEQIIQTSVDASVNLMKDMYPAVDCEALLRDFYNRHLDTQTLFNETANLYAQVFTVEELQGMLDYYSSSVGQSALGKLPDLMQASIQLIHTHLIDHMGELEALLEEVGHEVHLDAPVEGEAHTLELPVEHNS